MDEHENFDGLHARLLGGSRCSCCGSQAVEHRRRSRRHDVRHCPSKRCRGCTKILGKDHPAVKSALHNARDLKNVRDMLTHFDAYAMGTGNLQKSLDGSDGHFGWLPVWNSDETILILTQRRGEEQGTHYEVPINAALRAVAALVLAAAASLGMQPSPLLERVTSTETTPSD